MVHMAAVGLAEAAAKSEFVQGKVRRVGNSIRTHKLRTSLLVAGTAVSVFAGAEAALGETGHDTQVLKNPGVAKVVHLQKIPPTICLYKADAVYEGVGTHYSEDHTLTPDGWVDETTSGTKEFTVCVKTDVLKRARKATTGKYAGKVVIKVDANGSVNSDATMIIYDKDPTLNKNHYDDNWVHRTYGFAESGANLFGAGIDTGQGIEADLLALNQVQANYLVQQKCGGPSLRAMSDPANKKLYIGNELKDFYIHGTAGAQGLTRDGVALIWDISGTAIADQDTFNHTLQNIQDNHDGFQFSVAGAPDCNVDSAALK